MSLTPDDIEVKVLLLDQAKVRIEELEQENTALKYQLMRIASGLTSRAPNATPPGVDNPGIVPPLERAIDKQ